MCISLKVKFKLILGDSPTSHSRSYQLPMLMPFQVQAAAGGQNVIGGLLTLTVSRLVLCLSVYSVLENIFFSWRRTFNLQASKQSIWALHELISRFGIELTMRQNGVLNFDERHIYLRIYGECTSHQSY